jgi:hypothetical protein
MGTYESCLLLFLTDLKNVAALALRMEDLHSPPTISKLELVRWFQKHSLKIRRESN